MQSPVGSRPPVFLFALIAAGLMILAEDAWARAGGGSSGGGSRNGGIIELLVYVAMGIWTAILGYFVHRKDRQCKALLEQLAKRDLAWEPRALKARIEETYFKVQQAWKERNQDLAREYMSDRLYEKHKLQTDEMVRDGLKPIMNCINLKKASIVEVLDFEDDSRDRFCAHIEGSMVDYVINQQTREMVSGNAGNASFREFWIFVRQGDKWVLDEIDQTVTASELLDMGARSEA